MSDQVLMALGLGTLALVYYVFLRLVRSAWMASRPSRDDGSREATRLVVVSPAALSGRAFGLTGDLTLGRAAGCVVTVDDGHVSQVHARVFEQHGRAVVEDLGSTNGTYLNRARVTGPTVIRTGDRLQVGDTVLEVA